MRRAAPLPGRVADLADRFGLADRLDSRPQTLSRGMRQRMASARALVGARVGDERTVRRAWSGAAGLPARGSSWFRAKRTRPSVPPIAWLTTALQPLVRELLLDRKDLLGVADFLDAARGGLYMAPNAADARATFLTARLALRAKTSGDASLLAQSRFEELEGFIVRTLDEIRYGTEGTAVVQDADGSRLVTMSRMVPRGITA